MHARRTTAATVALLAGGLTLSAAVPSFAVAPAAASVVHAQSAVAAAKGSAVPLAPLGIEIGNFVRNGDIDAAIAHRLRPLLSEAAHAATARRYQARDAALSQVRDVLNSAGLGQVDPFAEHRLQQELMTWLDAPSGLAALQATTRRLLESGDVSSRFAAQVQSRLLRAANDPGPALSNLLRLVDHASSMEATEAAQRTLQAAVQRLLLGVTSSSSGLTIKMTNNSGKDFTLTRETKSYGDWTTHFPTSLPNGATVTGSATSNNINGQHMSADYSSADGTTFHCEGNVPLGGYNVATGSVGGTDKNAYTVSYSIGSGYHPTATCTLKPR